MSQDKSCVGCLFFAKITTELNKGQCRRYPPTANVIAVSEGAHTQVRSLCSYPIVGDKDWCGEHRTEHTGQEERSKYFADMPCVCPRCDSKIEVTSGEKFLYVCPDCGWKSKEFPVTAPPTISTRT